MGPDAMIFVFWMLSFKPAFSLSSCPLKRLFSSSFSAIRVVSSAYLRIVIFLPAILIPACASSSLAFCNVLCTLLNKKADNTQPWHTTIPVCNQFVVHDWFYLLTSWPAYRFLMKQVRWSGLPISKNFPQFVVTYTVKGFGIVNKAEVDIFLVFSCFINDPTDVGNLISLKVDVKCFELLHFHFSFSIKWNPLNMYFISLLKLVEI